VIGKPQLFLSPLVLRRQLGGAVAFTAL